MEYKLRNDILRRDEETIQFYYRNIGQIIKKRRTELNLTQEALAKGICSNTYISKIENNQIDIKEENLLLIMEKMDLPMEIISFPDEMVEYLEKSLIYFFYKDIEKYEDLMQEIGKYEFGILLSICKMGYYTLIENYQEAGKIHDEMFQYLKCLEDFGFTSFLIYSCFYNLGICNYMRAKAVLESIDENMQNNEIFLGLYTYAKFLIYGNIHRFNKSRDALNTCLNLFIQQENINRINDLLVWKNLFLIYEDAKTEIPFSRYNLDKLLPNEKNFYLLIYIAHSKEPDKYLKYFDKDNWFYACGCFFVAKHCLNKNKYEEYKKIIDEIDETNFGETCPIDFANLLRLIEKDEYIHLKEYLINIVLPYVFEIQNIFFMNAVTDKISRILSEHKRYKDSLAYIRRNNKRIEEIQNYTI